MLPATPEAHPGQSRHVVVIGGGLAGLVAALDLGRGGPDVRVTLLEATDRVGGKLALAEVAGHRVDVGAEAMLALRPEGVDLIRDLGAGDDIVAPETTLASIWSRGALHPIPRATLMGIPSSHDGLGALLDEEEQARLDAEQPWDGPVEPDVSVGDYIGTRLGQAVIDRLVEPLLGGVYAGRADELSLRATMPAVWTAAVAGGSLLEAARRSAPPPPPPGQSGRPVFAGIRGGVGRLPELLLDALPDGVEVRTTTTCRAIEPADNGFRVLVGPTTAEEWIEADAVIVATPPTAAGRLLGSVAPVAGASLSAMPTASSAVITMAFPRAGMPTLEGSGFLVPSVDGHLVKGATFSGNKWAWTGELDPDVVYVRTSIGRAGEEALLQRPDEELVATCVRELGEAVGATLPAPIDSHVQRWGGGLPQYTIGHVERMAAATAAVAAVPGIEVCGAAYQGVGIPAVIASAHAAAATILTHLGTGADRTGE